MMNKTNEILIVLPALKVSGGAYEALRLGCDLEATGGRVGTVVMWRSPEEIAVKPSQLYVLSNWFTQIHLALFQLPILIKRFRNFVQTRKFSQCNWIFTHYSTLPLALLVPRERRWFFVQGVEWKFVNNYFISYFLRIIIVWVYQRSNLITANPYLSSELKSAGLTVRAVTPIWADKIFHYPIDKEKNIDVLMILRKGGCKRLDLYLYALDWFKNHAPNLRIAVITTEDDIGEAVYDKTSECYIRPGGPVVMRNIYCRSKILLHLSEHEGFALPPLEGMGSGCVPFCRNSGGPQAYMMSPLDTLLFPLNYPIESLFDQVIKLLNNQIKWKTMSDASIQAFQLGLENTKQRPIILASLFGTSAEMLDSNNQI